MSANLAKEDRLWTLGITPTQRTLYKDEEELICIKWDTETNQDIQLIEKAIREEKIFKKVSLYKVLVFPFEYIIMFFTLDKKPRENKKDLFKLYYKFLRGKIKIKQFKKDLNELVKLSVVT